MTRNIFLSTFAAWEHFSKHRSREFAAQYSISKPPTSLSCGKPLGSPSSSSLSDTIFAVTSSSSSVKSNVIFFKPKPAFLRIWFCVAMGTREDQASARQTNCGDHGFGFWAFRRPLLLLLPGCRLVDGLLMLNRCALSAATASDMDDEGWPLRLDLLHASQKTNSVPDCF